MGSLFMDPRCYLSGIPLSEISLFTVLDLFTQYGYHISALNQIQAVLTCKTQSHPLHHGLPTCVPMSDFTFSVVTAIFTIGGLCGSLVANLIMDRWGRKGATNISAVSIATGACLMAIAASVSVLSLGRQVCSMSLQTDLLYRPL